MNLPVKTRIGIIGGGQLGKMLIESSRSWNVHYTILENDAYCPASLVADKVIVGSLMDADKIRELAAECDVLTWEIEHINVDALLELEREGVKIIPSPATLKIIQDKGLQKQFYAENGLSTAAFELMDTHAQLVEGIKKLTGEKVVVKSRTGGYDGKGVEIVAKADIENGSFTLKQPSVLEQFHAEITEYAVIVARNGEGQTSVFPLIEMYFHPVSNLVEFLFSPARISPEVESQCKQLAMGAIEKLNGVGLFAVELFVTEQQQVLINEIAPRPHNSGHHTIEGCYTSQFEQLNRVLLNMPLGSTNLVQPCAMINLVGPENLSGEYRLNSDALLMHEGVYVHLYNKAEIRPNRKMGHVTVLSPSLDELIEKAENIRSIIEFT